MTNLTEQWKQGKLPSGEYYVKDELGLTDTYKYYKGLGFAGGVPQEVLAEVPSYDELNTLKKFMASGINATNRINELEKLLKEIRGKLKYVNTPKNTHNVFGNDMMKKIDQVLGE